MSVASLDKKNVIMYSDAVGILQSSAIPENLPTQLKAYAGWKVATVNLTTNQSFKLQNKPNTHKTEVCLDKTNPHNESQHLGGNNNSQFCDCNHSKSQTDITKGLSDVYSSV